MSGPCEEIADGSHVSVNRAVHSYKKCTLTLGGCRRPLLCITHSSPERKSSTETSL